MILLIDMDSVSYNITKKWVDTYNAQYNDNITYKEAEKSWDPPARIKCSPEEYRQLADAPGFFADLELFPDAIEVSKRLMAAGHSIYFLTATPLMNPTAGYDKMNSVNRDFPHIGHKQVIQAHHKFMALGDLLLDDSGRNLETFPKLKVAMNYPHNQSYKVDARVNSWLEFEIAVNELAAKHFPK